MHDESTIIAIAEKFGQLPHDVENRMSDYWFKRVVVQMDAEVLDRQRRERELEEKTKRR